LLAYGGFFLAEVDSSLKVIKLYEYNHLSLVASILDLLECLIFLLPSIEIAEYFGMTEVLLVVLHEELPCLLIEGTLGEWYNHQAFNDLTFIYDLGTSNMFFNDHCSGFQSFFRVFTHISPFSDTFGWNILVKK
jgi:hypothetical protein